MKIPLMILITSLTFVLHSTEALAELKVMVQAPESPDDTRPLYYRELLQLALDKTKQSHEAAEIVTAPIVAAQSRNIDLVKEGRGIDVIWTMTSKERETELTPIRIPLLKGLLGHRICLIREGTQAKFEGVKSVEDFKKRGLSVGSGHDWPDTQILIDAGFNVFKGSSYEGLFSMLEKKRFDCYARGVNEAFAEAETHADQKLVAETGLAIVYRSPIYFFTSPQAQDLAKRIEIGLRSAIQDGSFEEVFMKHQKANLELAKLDKRTLISIPNSIMPEKTPVNDPSLWLSFD